MHCDFSESFDSSCLELQKRFPEQFHFSETNTYTDATFSKNADVYFSLEMPSKDRINWIIEEGIVPVVPNNGIFINFDPKAESGSGFTFDEGNFWRMFEAMIRAGETRKFSYDWRNIKQAVRKTVV